MRVAGTFMALFVCLSGLAQRKAVDSLARLVATTKDNNAKFTYLLKLNDYSIDPDTLLPYVIAAEKLAASLHDKDKIASAAFFRSSYYARKNMIDSALAITDALIKQYKEHKDQQPFLEYSFFRAKVLDRGNRYSQALTQLYDVVETAAAQHDTLRLIQARTGIGWVLIEMEQYKDALKWLHQALHTSPDQHYYRNYGALFSNTAVAYNGIGNKDSAVYFINKAIEDARQNNNLLFLATALSMQAKIFTDNGMVQKAEAPLKEVLQIRKLLNDPFYVVFDMSSLASYYAKNGQPEKGISLCLEGIEVAKKLQLPSQLLMIYRSLAENYQAAGNQHEYGKALESIIALKDSFNNVNSAKILAELHDANENKKKEKTISEQKLKLTLTNYFLFGGALFLIMAGIIAWLGFKNYRRRQQLNMQLAIEKEKIVAAQAVKDAGEQERKRIAADLHDNLGAQANAILYSIELLQQEKEKHHLVTDLHHTAKDMLASLREALWVLKKTDVTAVDTWIRIINFSQHISRHYPNVRMHADGVAPPELHLSSAQALNIVLIVQEAINNALRHSSASSVTVSSEYANGQWKLSVADDGTGFDKDATNGRENYGLTNMKERAMGAQLELHISSGPQNGTVIQLLVATQQLIQKEY